MVGGGDGYEGGGDSNTVDDSTCGQFKMVTGTLCGCLAES